MLGENRADILLEEFHPGGIHLSLGLGFCGGRTLGGHTIGHRFHLHLLAAQTSDAEQEEERSGAGGLKRKEHKGNG